MESTGRFEKKFLNILKEDNIAGGGGALGGGAGFDPEAGEINSSDWYAPGDARIPKVLGKGKVQTRNLATGGKKKKKKKKEKGVSYATGEENEEDKTNQPKGLDTCWEDGDLKICMPEVLEYLDDNKVPVKEVSTDKLKSILIAGPRDPKRVQAADLKYPAVVVVDMKGKYKSILDGNHRVEKAINNDIPTIKVRELDLRDAPEEYKELFNYEIEKEHG